MLLGLAPRGRDSARLQPADFAKLLEFLRQTYAASDLGAFRQQVVSGLQNLIPSEINGYNEVNLRSQHNQVVYDRPEVLKLKDGDKIFDLHILEHPVIDFCKRKRAQGAVKISDLASTAQFHRLGLYNEFFRLLGIEDQMAVSLPSPPPVVIGIALNRSRRNFTERERLLLNLTYPHLLQAYQNIKALSRLKSEVNFAQHALRGSGVAVVWLNGGGTAQHMSLTARVLLGKYFPGHSSTGDRLPELVRRWTEQETARFGDADDVPPARTPLVVRHDADALIIRIFSDRGQAGLLLEESLGSRNDIEGEGLTRREQDVLSWIGRGKTNREISIMLGISPRTVQKHLEHIFQKLGVQTRTAAVATALPRMPAR